MENFEIIAELSKNAKKLAGTPNNDILYSWYQRSDLKNRLKIIRSCYSF